VDEGDRRVRNTTYRLFVDLGRAPRADDVAATEGSTTLAVEAAWRRLHDAHALVLTPGGEIRMAHPFAAAPTAYRVQAANRWWYANCAWDAFGICAALRVDGRIETSCPHCGAVITLAIRDEQPSDETLLCHFLIPAAGWWDDIGFT
jgi:hypothetical protein